ncbi:MAG: competence/damage-inducible protein A [Betaproteobacteria bacterium]|nr:competence/damage-inducible protein A [Betaproteobacteria bacterium]
MKFGAIIIGDEILSGKRQDKHMAKLIEALSTRGLELAWGQYIGDDPALITAMIQRALSLPEAIFSFGGIGATPDDHTRQCAAQAAGVALKLHPDAEAEIRARFAGDPKGVTPQRLAMGEFPIGSNIIPNPYNRIPGFSYKNIYFVPGFPQMAWPMIEGVLDTHYKHLHDAGRIGEAAIIVREAGESLLIDLMKAVQGKYPPLKIFSLPRVHPERFIELGARGDPGLVAAAIAELKQGVSAMKFPWTDAPKFGA